MGFIGRIARFSKRRIDKISSAIKSKIEIKIGDLGGKAPLDSMKEQLIKEITAETLREIKSDLPVDPTGETSAVVQAEIEAEVTRQVEEYLRR